jgi:subtilisin family serine protease
MKTYLLLFCLICSFGLGFSQNQASDFTGHKSDQPRNPRADQMNFVPNEVLVKFKDAVPVAAGARVKAAGVSSVDQVLKAHGITSLERLFPTAQKPLRARMMKSPQGKDMTIPALDKIYRVSIPPTQATDSMPSNIFQLIEELKALPEVEYAEPNYIYSIDDMQPVGPILTAEDVAKMQTPKQKSTTTAFIPNDPLYSQQGYIQTVKADSVWQQTTGDSTQVIAILDTGVDWNHPDLKNKIWTNPNPATSWNMDGILNDVRGWDFINNDNNPMDDNSHGTHVAGIAAAETNNGIGIVGVCPKAKIMPIKVFTSKGTGDVATIVKGINYAAKHGATVINMSFGSYAPSLTMETALLNAYPSAILVAAAGNDSHSIYDALPSGFPAICYPAALSYVFGVQSDGGYSNYDPDGPVYSESAYGLNYELKAPGSALSTVPNGNYRIFQGTSMATPIVSGSVALYRSFFPNKSLEELWSDFIHCSTGDIDLNKVFFSTSKIPQLDLVSYTIDDQNAGNDKDNKPDAGETVNLTLKIRNTGSPANVVYAKIRTINDGNPDDITILKDSVNFGSIGIFSSLINDTIPFKIKINKNCNNNSNVSLDVFMHNNVDTTVFVQNIKFKIYNGQELSGILLRDTTFTPDKNWVISNSLRISTGVTLTILPGTSVEVLAGVDNRGKVIAIGTPEKRISMKGVIGGDAVYKYANIDAKGGSCGNDIEYCDILNLGSGASKIKYSKISNMSASGVNFICDSIYRCLIESYVVANYFQVNIYESIIGNYWDTGGTNITKSINTVYNNINNFDVKIYPTWSTDKLPKFYMFNYDGSNKNIVKNTFLKNGTISYFFKTSGSADMVTLPNQYWGTNDKDKIKLKYVDFATDAGTPYFNFEPKLIAPSDSCPGLVWKVLVNGKDAQDEVVDPVGVGKQRFDVYFNRAMNKDSIPQVSFGGIYPYTSNKINENGLWSDDGKIYTVYKTIKLTTGDGINQIRVAGAKQAGDWGWVIPVEDSRFSFIISAANSASLDFMATAGLGKVKLEWNNNDLVDGLGYNMYRMEQINDSTLSSPVMVNPTLITDTLYTDFSVTPNKKYYYYYKILRTNLVETDSSKVVSAIPFTASKGDANGDLSVNVLDITSIVAYLLNNNPQPFIFEAADVNSDATINVLDIVGVVNLVLNGPHNVKSLTLDQQANLYLENDTLFADVNVPVGGIQFDISGVSSIEDIQTLKALQGFESGYSMKSDTLRLLYYSMSGKSIPAGYHIPLLVMKPGSKIVNVIFGGTNGSPIRVNFLLTRIPDISNNMNQTVAELGQNFPNPLNGQTTIPIHIYEPVYEAVLRVVNMMGQEVEIIRLANPYIGEHLLSWNPGTNKGLFVYTLEVNTAGKRSVCPNKKMIVQ